MRYQKGVESREAIIDAAARVVLQRGFDATSFGDVCDAIGTSRGKLTHHFPTKEALFEAILENRFSRFRQRIIDPLLDESLAPVARLRASFDAIRGIYTDPVRVPGCYVGHSAMELASRTATMTAMLNRLLDDWRAAVASALVAVGRSPETAVRQAFLTISATQGAVLMARAQPDKTALVETLNELEHMLLSGTPSDERGTAVR